MPTKKCYFTSRTGAKDGGCTLIVSCIVLDSTMKTYKIIQELKKDWIAYND